MQLRRSRSWFVGAAATVAAVVLAWGLPARAQDGAAAGQELELRYVDGLNKLGLPAYAQIVLDRLGAGPEVKALRLENALARGEFDKVVATIAAEPDQGSLTVWAMKLKLADGYFAWGKYPEARKIYDEFFAKYAAGAPAEVKNFYYESAYKYAQMMILMNDAAGAINAYHLGIRANPPREIKRQMQGGLGDLLVKEAERQTGTERAKDLTEAEQIATELMWIQDLWFGRAIVMLAHVKMLKGDVDGAMKLVDDYRDPLQELDKSLQEESTAEEDFTKLSPMAEARYLVGAILLDEGKRELANGNKAKALELLAGKNETVSGKETRKIPGAIHHFINVFVNYPTTPWAADAGAKYEETTAILTESLGKKITLNVDKDQWSKVEKEQAKTARALLNQQKYAEAADQYIALLRRSPEGELALGALSDLGTCYVELNNEIYADTVIGYIAERFSQNPKTTARAGDIVLGFANMYVTRKRPERKDAIYELYFRNFKTHALAAQLLTASGNRRLATNDYAGALVYYQRVANDHSNAPIAFDALSRMALCYENLGDTSNQVKVLDTYIGRAKAARRLDHELIRIQYRLATVYRDQGPVSYPRAVTLYNDIETALTTNRASFQTTVEEGTRNQELLELSMYYKGSCFARAKPPKGKPENAYKETALAVFRKLVDTYPKSKVAPTALSQAGTLWTVLGNAQEAQKAFERLKSEYPDSPEAKNVDFLLGRTLLELGKRTEAVSVFKKMFEGGGKYSDVQILTAGNELFKAGEFEIALEAFERVLKSADPTNRQLVEPAMANKGCSLVELGRYVDGVAALDALFAQYPKTPYTVRCAQSLSRACAELGGQEKDPKTRMELFNKAVTAMQTVVKYDSSTARRGEVTVQVGRICELKAKAEDTFGTPEAAKEFRKEAIASYQILTLFENPTDVDMRAHLEQAYFRCMALYGELEMWQDLVEDSAKYLQAFPRGEHVLDVRQWRSRATSRLAGQTGGTGEAPSTTAPAPTPEPVTAPPPPASGSEAPTPGS